jgi:hypothetical protein
MNPITFFPRNPHNGNVDSFFHIYFHQDKVNPNLFLKFESNYPVPKVYVFSNIINKVQTPLYYKPENEYGPEGYLYEFIPINIPTVPVNLERKDSYSDIDTDSGNNSEISDDTYNIETQTELITTKEIGIQCNITNDLYNSKLIKKKKYTLIWKNILNRNKFLKRKYFDNWLSNKNKNLYLKKKYLSLWKKNYLRNKYKRERNFKKKRETKIKKDIVKFWSNYKYRSYQQKYFSIWKCNTKKRLHLQQKYFEKWKTSLKCVINKELDSVTEKSLSNMDDVHSTTIKKKIETSEADSSELNKVTKKSRKNKKRKKKSKISTNNINLYNAFDTEPLYFFNQIDKIDKKSKTKNLNTRIYSKIFYYLDVDAYINVLKVNKAFKSIACNNLVRIPITKKIIMDELSNRNILHMNIYNLNDSLKSLFTELYSNTKFKELSADSKLKLTINFDNKIVKLAICNLYPYNTDEFFDEFPDSNINLEKHVSKIKEIILNDEKINKNVYIIVCNPEHFFEIIEFNFKTKEFLTFAISPIHFVKYLVEMISTILTIQNRDSVNMFERNEPLPINSLIYNFMEFNGINKPSIHLNIVKIIKSIIDTRILIKYLNFNNIFESFHKECCILESRLIMFADIFTIWYTYSVHIFPSIFNEWFNYLDKLKNPCYLCGKNIDTKQKSVCFNTNYNCHSNCIEKYSFNKPKIDMIKDHPCKMNIIFDKTYFESLPEIYSIIKTNNNIFSPLMFIPNLKTTMELSREVIKSFKFLDKTYAEKYIYSAYTKYFKNINNDILKIVESYKFEIKDTLKDVNIVGKISDVLKDVKKNKDEEKLKEVRLAYRKYLKLCKKKNLNKYNLLVIEDITDNYKIYVTSASYLKTLTEKKI